jgi:flagella basal body P-ring formation protein FlgA
MTPTPSAIVFVSVATALAAVAAAAAPGEAVLREQLAQRYPKVTRWEVRPLANAHSIVAHGAAAAHGTTSSDGATVAHGATASDGATDPAAVVLLGSRSAVRVRNRVFWYDVAGFEDAVSVIHGVSRGDPLEPTDATLSERDVVAAHCDAVRAVDALHGMRASRTLGTNQIVCADSIEKRPPVTRGEEVTVRYLGPKVTLTTKGIAENDAALGAALLVRNPETHDSFRAVASGVGEVTINE